CGRSRRQRQRSAGRSDRKSATLKKASVVHGDGTLGDVCAACNRQPGDSKTAIWRSLDPGAASARVLWIGDEPPVDFDTIAVPDDRVAQAAPAENPDRSMGNIRCIEPRV